MATYPAEDLRRQLEQMAGKVVTGPDTPTLEFELNGTHSINYQSMMLGGYSNEMLAANEAMMMATMKQFVVLGNPIRLIRVMGMQGPMPIPPAEGIPQGPILVWRGEAGEPTVEEEDGTYAISLTFCVLPPFVQLTGAAAAAPSRMVTQAGPPPMPMPATPPSPEQHVHGPGGHTHEPTPPPAAAPPPDPRRGRVPPRRQ